MSNPTRRAVGVSALTGRHGVLLKPASSSNSGGGDNSAGTGNGDNGITSTSASTSTSTGTGTGTGTSTSTSNAAPNLNAALRDHGSTLRASHADSLNTQLSVFQQLLHSFSVQHGRAIRRNPTFRAEFAHMCAALGVDPLAAAAAASSWPVSSGPASVSGSGSAPPPTTTTSPATAAAAAATAATTAATTAAALLGGSVADFYLELAVRVVEVCRASRLEDGGLLTVADVRRRIRAGGAVANNGIEVSDDDILRAVRSLEPLGPGFSIVRLGEQQLIRSVATELSGDQAVVLDAIARDPRAHVAASALQRSLRWDRARAVAVLDDLLAASLVWLDRRPACEDLYWSPAFIHAGP